MWSLHYTIAIDTDGTDQNNIPPELLEISATIFCEAVELYSQGRFIEALPAFQMVLGVYDYFRTRPPYSAAIEVPIIKTCLAKCLRAMELYDSAFEHCTEAIFDFLYIGYDINDRIIVDLTDLANDIFGRLHIVRPMIHADFAPAAWEICINALYLCSKSHNTEKHVLTCEAESLCSEIIHEMSSTGVPHAPATWAPVKKTKYFVMDGDIHHFIVSDFVACKLSYSLTKLSWTHITSFSTKVTMKQGDFFLGLHSWSAHSDAEFQMFYFIPDPDIVKLKKWDAILRLHSGLLL